MSVDDRKLQVLRAIVTDYVSSQEPVGSKALVERHNLGVSPATVRNDMAALEEEGYITQPHTSAGRIPTDKGYRLFVDRLGSVKPLSPAEQRAIHTFLSGAMDLDDVLHRTVRLLAHEHPQALDEIGDLGNEDKDLERVLAGDAAADLLGVLHGLDRRVMELLIGFDGEPMTYAQIARELGMTSNRVRRAEHRALQRLREVCPQAARDRLAG